MSPCSRSCLSLTFDDRVCRAVYGYAKDSCDLELVTTGSGLQELSDELDASKIQYAFLRVLDPNTELTKFVLIHWVSEASESLRRSY